MTLNIQKYNVYVHVFLHLLCLLIVVLKQVSSTDIVLETTGPTQGFLENDSSTGEQHDEEMSSEENGKESEQEMEDDVDEEVLFPSFLEKIC